jgi:hypothetical protein
MARHPGDRPSGLTAPAPDMEKAARATNADGPRTLQQATTHSITKRGAGWPACSPVRGSS